MNCHYCERYIKTGKSAVFFTGKIGVLKVKGNHSEKFNLLKCTVCGYEELKRKSDR